MGPSGRVGLQRSLVFVVMLSAFMGCGGDSPARPTAAAVPVGPPTWKLKGSVTETLTGNPIEGAELTFTLSSGAANTSAKTSATGEWEITNTSHQGLAEVSVSAPGFISRQLHLSPPSASRAIAIDLIRDAAPFSLSYYRELVRDQFDEPDTPQPIRRWRKNPNFYINLRNPGTGENIADAERDKIISTIRAAVPQMTGGQFEAGTIETGSEERPLQAGTINVLITHEPESEFCGYALIGADPGRIRLNFGSPGCVTRCGVIAQRTIAHEVGHAMGFYHVSQGTVLQSLWYDRDCGTTTFSPAERYHAKVAYARPPGNTDVDVDPTSALMARPESTDPREVSCR